MARLRTGDRVVVIAGNERGKEGKVLRMHGERVVIEGINVRKKHMRSRQEGQQSQIINIECPIHISNVKLLSEEGKAVRLKARVNKKNEKEFVYLVEGKEHLYRLANKPAKS